MGELIQLTAADGWDLNGDRAEPEGPTHGGASGSP
jgi:hypothetical protein